MENSVFLSVPEYCDVGKITHFELSGFSTVVVELGDVEADSQFPATEH
jgi:hypothetical protein